MTRRESETPAKWRLNNKIDECVNKTKKTIYFNEYYGQQLYVKCQYLSLRKYSHDEALIEKELEKLYDRTESYVKGCIEDAEFRRAISENKVEEYLMSLATVNSRYNKLREDFNMILVIATMNDYMFNDLYDAYTELAEHRV